MILCVVLFLFNCVQNRNIPMTNQPLTISAKCKGNEGCAYSGQNLFVQIAITNRGSLTVGFPLAFRQKTGPSIRLVDKRTKADAYLKTNLADHELRHEFTEILPGQSAILEWVITAVELEQFGRPVDVTAECTLMAEIKVDSRLVEFKGADILRIVSKVAK